LRRWQFGIRLGNVEGVGRGITRSSASLLPPHCARRNDASPGRRQAVGHQRTTRNDDKQRRQLHERSCSTRIRADGRCARTGLIIPRSLVRSQPGPPSDLQICRSRGVAESRLQTSCKRRLKMTDRFRDGGSRDRGGPAFWRLRRGQPQDRQMRSCSRRLERARRAGSRSAPDRCPFGHGRPLDAASKGAKRTYGDFFNGTVGSEGCTCM